MNAFGYALGAAVTWGVAPILEKLALGRAEPVPGLVPRSLGVIAGLLVLFPFVPEWKASTLQMGWKEAGLFALAGFLASIVGQYFAYNAMKRAEVSLLGPVFASWPVLVLILGWLVMGEALTARKIAGCLLVVSGVWLLK